MRPDQTYSKNSTFAPTQEDLDQLSSKLNQHFYDQTFRRLHRKLKEWEERHSVRRVLQSIKPEFVTRDISWAWLPLIWLVRLIALFVKTLFLPLSLVLLLIRRGLTPKPTAGSLPKISFQIAEAATFLEIKAKVDKFVKENGELFFREDDLLDACEQTSPRLVDPHTFAEKALRTSFRQMEEYRNVLWSRRSTFLFPPTIEKINRKKLHRISPTPTTDHEINQNWLKAALGETGIARSETEAIYDYLLRKIATPTSNQPPLLFCFEYHEVTAPKHSINIRLTPLGKSITISKYVPDWEEIQALETQGTGFYGEKAYCESIQFDGGSFSRSPDNSRWQAFNDTIRKLDLGEKPRSGNDRFLNEKSSDKTIWTLFIHYGDSVILTSDSTRGPIGHEVASAVARLIS